MNRHAIARYPARPTRDVVRRMLIVVLVRALERHVLTDTPSNASGWRVKAANVGRHYYQWRYLAPGGEPVEAFGVKVNRDLSANWMFLGEMKNHARAAYGDVEVRVELLYNTGELVGEYSAHVDTSLSQEGESFPFQAWTDTGAVRRLPDQGARPAKSSLHPAADGACRALGGLGESDSTYRARCRAIRTRRSPSRSS
jgi:hypothetical protein